MIKVGDRAPSFCLPSAEGTKISLKDFKGKKIVLYFYPKDSTSGCTKEACSFQENIPSLRRKGSVLLGVSADSVSSHNKFASRYGLSFPLLSDEKKDILKAYGVWKEKSLYGRKYMGIERTTFLIDERGKITHIFSKVKVEGHAQDVLDVL
jgi:peroxiredoxin Q/BCP